MNCIECKHQSHRMWRTEKGFMCGHCAQLSVQRDTDISDWTFAREAYINQFSVGFSLQPPLWTIRVVSEVVRKCLQQTR